MLRSYVTSNLAGKLVFLGTGTSTGVPVVGCGCDVCQSGDPRNMRTRCGLALGLPEGVLLVDTPPELRLQLVRQKIGLAHAVLYTHDHSDHLLGLDDVRVFASYTGEATKIYCEGFVEERIRKAFDYCFSDAPGTGGYIPRLQFHRIGLEPFRCLGCDVVPLRLKHGNFEVLGFRFGNVAYCTDTNHIPPESLAKLQNLDLLILDCLRLTPHYSHFHLEKAVEVAQQIGAKRTLFTHVSCSLDHEKTNASLPRGISLAYDGLWCDLT